MEYFVFENGIQEGPFTLTQLMARGLRAETLVLSMDSNTWTPAWQVDELKALLDGDRTVSTPSDDAGVAGGDESSDTGGDTGVTGGVADADSFVEHTCSAVHSSCPPKRKHHTGCLAFVAVIAGLVVLLAATNPTRQQHVEAVKSELVNVVSSSMGVDNDFLGLFGLGSLRASGLVDLIADQVLRVDSYGLFSVGHLTFGKYDKVVSFGILGHVLTVDSKSVEKKIKGEDPSGAGGSVKGNDGDDDGEEGNGADDGDEDDGSGDFPTESV